MQINLREFWQTSSNLSSRASVACGTSGMSGKQKGAKTRRRCKVCGDRASGKHYGVISCDGCRGFFKRVIRKKLGPLYRCKDSNSCVVDVSRRNNCQACRYRRCVEVNMDPNAVQRERPAKQGSPQVPTVDLNSYPDRSADNSYFLHNCTMNNFYPLPGIASPYHSQVCPATGSTFLNWTSTQQHIQPGISSFLIPNLFAHAMPPFSLPDVTSGAEMVCTSRSSESEEMQIVMRALKTVHANIRWVAGLTTLGELTQQDQLVLMTQSWSELLVLSALQNQLCADFAYFLTLSSVHNKETISNDLITIASRTQILAPVSREFDLLRCLAVFRPERQGLGDPTTVEAIQDSLSISLNQHIQSMVPPIPAPGLRHTKLLLLLSDIQHFDSMALGIALLSRVPNAPQPVENFVSNLLSQALGNR